MKAETTLQQDLESRFRLLVERWIEETEAESSILRMMRHPAYQEIISLGESALPLLLDELRRRPDYWFAALQQITGVNPVPKESAGKIQAMTTAWLRWGREKGLLS